MSAISDSPGNVPLRRWEIIALLYALPWVIGFGALTVWRSNYADNRMTDYGVYARAAWALRTGADLYTVKDDNGWHYIYPPLFAFLCLPLADPPAGHDRTGYIPYDVGVSLVYLLNLFFIGYTAHTLASLVLPDARRWSRRWWYARLIPFDVCLAALALTLNRSQTNVFLVAMITAAFAASIRCKPIRAGCWWAACICIKIFPAVLLAFPFTRFEWKSAIGLLLGAILMVYFIPATVFGFEGAWNENLHFVDRVIMPSFGKEPDPELAEELHNINSNFSQSFMGILTYVQYEQGTYPKKADPIPKLIHFCIAGFMIIAGFLVGFRLSRPMLAHSALVCLGMWCLTMILIAPMSHQHYTAFAYVAVSGLWLRSMHFRPGTVLGHPWVLAGLLAWGILNAISMIGGDFFLRVRHCGLATWATFLLWIWCVVVLWREGETKNISKFRKDGALE